MQSEHQFDHSYQRIKHNLPALQEIGKSSARIAVVCHVHYPELWASLERNFELIEEDFDLFVTLTPSAAPSIVENIKTRHRSAKILEFPNHGRDIFPFVTLVNSGLIEQYDLVCKLHTKKSPHREDGVKWGNHLVSGILGSRLNVERILAKFDEEEHLGILVAQGHIFEGGVWWGQNYGIAHFLAQGIDIEIDHVEPRFAVGSIFWIRGPLLRPFRLLNLSEKDFPLELNQMDGTVHHAIERLFSIVAQHQGYDVCESRDVGGILFARSDVESVANSTPTPHQALEVATQIDEPSVTDRERAGPQNADPLETRIHELEARIQVREREIQLLRASTSWRLTTPLRLIKTRWLGFISRAYPSEIDGSQELGLSVNALPNEHITVTTATTPDQLPREEERHALPATPAATTPRELVERRFTNIRPVPTIHAKRDLPRLNLVVDALMENLLYGGVATSILFSFLLAARLQCPLRIITRDLRSSPSLLGQLSRLHNVSLPDDLQILDCQPMYDPERYIDVSLEDVFIATSWWSATAVKSMTLRNRYVYLIQEYEPVFYPRGDEELMARKVFSDDNCIPVVNGGALYKHFVTHGYDHIKENGLVFEPSFPATMYRAGDYAFEKKAQYRMMFYGRPEVPRNLYYTGLQLIDTALQQGIVDEDEWQLFIVGAEPVDFVFSTGTVPVQPGKLNWDDYSSFASTVDLGVCLMYAPTPSYPPYDLIASGAVVLTTSFESQDVKSCSGNFLVATPTMDSLLEKLKDAVALSKNPTKRQSNYDRTVLQRNWSISFETTLDALESLL